MTEFTKEEVGYMSEALRLAKQGCYTTHPNPRVGCVIVSDGEIVVRMQRFMLFVMQEKKPRKQQPISHLSLAHIMGKPALVMRR